MARKNKTPEDLGIDLADGKPQQLYRWFLACLLFARPIQQDIAANAYKLLIQRGFTSPKKFGPVGREPLRRILDHAKYSRYDYVTTDELHEVMAQVIDRYGSVNGMVKGAASAEELRERLLEFKGFGDRAVEIFLREVPAEFNGKKPSGN
jgi:hypothetical protein